MSYSFTKFVGNFSSPCVPILFIWAANKFQCFRWFWFPLVFKEMIMNLPNPTLISLNHKFPSPGIREEKTFCFIFNNFFPHNLDFFKWEDPAKGCKTVILGSISEQKSHPMCTCNTFSNLYIGKTMRVSSSIWN